MTRTVSLQPVLSYIGSWCGALRCFFRTEVLTPGIPKHVVWGLKATEGLECCRSMFASRACISREAQCVQVALDVCIGDAALISAVTDAALAPLKSIAMLFAASHFEIVRLGNAGEFASSKSTVRWRLLPHAAFRSMACVSSETTMQQWLARARMVLAHVQLIFKACALRWTRSTAERSAACVRSKRVAT